MGTRLTGPLFADARQYQPLHRYEHFKLTIEIQEKSKNSLALSIITSHIMKVSASPGSEDRLLKYIC